MWYCFGCGEGGDVISFVQKIDHLNFAEAIEKQLGVMDLTALTMCMEHDLPVCVFDYKTAGNIRRVVAGERIGTIVTRS